LKNPTLPPPNSPAAAKTKAAKASTAPADAQPDAAPEKPATAAKPKPAASRKPPVAPAQPTAAASAPSVKPRKTAKPAPPADAPASTPDHPTPAVVAQLPSQETINGMIEEAAYYLAEKRNFAPGFEAEDWQAAKQQIMAQLQGAENPLP